MYIIPGFLISIITFPGVIVHEFAHQLFCRMSKVAIFEVCYFRVGNPSGYVKHEVPKKVSQQMLIGFGPFIINTIVGAIISMPASIQILKLKDYSNPLFLFLAWLGISIVMHSFPSIADVKSVWNSIREKDTPIAYKIFGTPIVGILFLCSLGSVAWLDVIFAVIVAMIIPDMLISILA